MFNALILALAASAVSATAPPLPTLNIDLSSVTTIGLGHAADFAHQLHVAYSSTVTGSCLFAAQPFHCAVSHFPQDAIEPWTPFTRVPICNGCIPGTRMPFDHCKSSPHVVDVGSLVDFPRRECGQNPINHHECFDDVKFFQPSRVFLFRGSKDEVYKSGAVENTVALLAQLMTDPSSSIQLVTDLPFGNVLPTNSTPYAGGSTPAGYDGPGQCLRHVYDTTALTAAEIHNASWIMYDQTSLTESGVGFQDSGWVYIPRACRETQCRLIVLPDTCNPGSASITESAQEFARYAEGSGLVLLHPCVGGAVDKSKYKHAKDVAEGKFDVYGQLSAAYTYQSAPHMRGVGNMIKQLMGKPVVPPSSKRRVVAPLSLETPDVIPMVEGHVIPVRLPSLHIDNRSVMVAGCSNTADFSHQFHVAFSSIVTGSCIFSGQPFQCATTRFEKDFMVPKSKGTAAGISCTKCPDNGTLIYDHCKNHPEWVDLDVLASIAETSDHVDDPRQHLVDARVFSFGPTHDRCYQQGSMENIANFHKRYAKNSSQVKLVIDQPFPHTLPTNQTPYFNHSKPAGYDGPGECLRHVLQDVVPAVLHSSSLYQDYWKPFNQLEFLTWKGDGMLPFGWFFTPPVCKIERCSLLVLPGSCVAPFSGQSFNHTGNSDDDFARYAVVNKIVILKPCAGGPIDVFKWPDNHENLRGMVDVYGQMGPDYATQKGGQMEPIGKMVRRLLESK